MTKIPLIASVVVLLFSCNNTTGVKTESSKKDTLMAITQEEQTPYEGEFIKRYKNGVTEQRGVMKAGKRTGCWKSFYPNGTPWSETTFSDGKKNGSTSSWYENGKKRYAGFYTNDLESGNWLFWDEAGVLVREKNFSLQ